MRNRRGFAAIALVVSASILLFIWAAAQHFTTSSIRRRVRMAETQRASALMALSSAEQLIVFVPALLALRTLPALPPGTPDEALGLAEAVGQAFSGWKPAEPLVLDVPLPWMTATMKHVPVGVEKSRVTAYLQRVEGGVPGNFDYQSDCESYGAWRSQPRWRDSSESDAEFTAERSRKYPGWGPLKMRGLARFEATTLAEGLGVRLRTTASLLRQVEVRSSPCPGQDPPDAGFSMSVHRVELGRRVVTSRGGPPRGEDP